MPDGSHWVVQKWARLLPPYGLRPTRAESAVELHLSHFSGEVPEFVVKTDWVYGRFDHLYGWLNYRGRGVYGFKNTAFGSPLDTWGRNVSVDTFDSAYGRGWRRENAFLTFPTQDGAYGAFCYGFFSHAYRGRVRPKGDGANYRARVMGPGVTPIVEWAGPSPGPFDATLDGLANVEQSKLFAGSRKCRAK
jgi:hypothetical protein